MTERPILFSAPMVRAVLSGTKTQTRRPIKSRSRKHPTFALQQEEFGWWPYLSDDGESIVTGDGMEIPMVCPFGEPGDQLWVREAFSGSIAYERHGYPLKEWGNKIHYLAEGNPRSGDWTKPRPSIHMPRALSRITLEITDVRVEQLQDITDADSQAEGAPCYVCGGALDGRSESDCHCFHRKAFVHDFRLLWESINGPESWSANPWVWVVEFQRISAARGE